MTNKKREKTAGELRIELRDVRKAVGKILDDYERTAKTLDKVTEQADGIEQTDHAANVQALKSEVLKSLESESDTINPPWERKGYDTKRAWLEAQE